jgi:hypothetical protein
MRAEVQQYYWGGKNDAGKKLTPVRHTAGASRGANGKTRRASYANLRDSNIRKTLKVRIKLGHQTIGWSRCPCGLFKENRRIRLDLACRPAKRGPEGPPGCPPLRVLAIGRVLAQWRLGGAHVVKPPRETWLLECSAARQSYCLVATQTLKKVPTHQPRRDAPKRGRILASCASSRTATPHLPTAAQHIASASQNCASSRISIAMCISKTSVLFPKAIEREHRV